MFLVLYVSHDVEQADAVLKCWVEAGIKGVTILESGGMHTPGREQCLRDDLAIIPTLSNLLRGNEVHHRTLFSAIEEQDLLDRVLKATREFVGDWSRRDVGILLVLPIAQAFGLEKDFS